jgi:hypothetical protein
MNVIRRQSWFVIALVVGIAYGAVGVILALPSDHARLWRLAAWAISAAIYCLHIGYEQFRLRNWFPTSSFHVAVAAAIGGFTLALAAFVHSWLIPPAYPRSRFYLALLVWPVLTGVPAFLVALVLTGLLAWLTPRRGAR